MLDTAQTALEITARHPVAEAEESRMQFVRLSVRLAQNALAPAALSPEQLQQELRELAQEATRLLPDQDFSLSPLSAAPLENISPV